MIKYLSILFLTIFISCNKTNSSGIIIKNKNYELYKVEKEKGVLILFPGYGHVSDDTKNEFNIVDIATKNGFSVLLMSFNQHVFLRDDEKISLEKELGKIFKTNKISYQKTYIGGFSSGGNVSLLLSDYLIKTKSKIQPKGVFIVDSPVDLLQIYQNSVKNIIKNFNIETVEESKWIIEDFNSKLGLPDRNIKNYEKFSPYIYKTGNVNNVSNLKGIKIRLYTEPDVEWWKQNSDNCYEEMNSYSIEKFSMELKNKRFSDIELIMTKNKGYRANGDKHPHSWSIVDINDLMKWMKK
jgi:hypothetical protein